MTFRVKKILVPIAFTDNCLEAKKYAEEIAVQFGAAIDLLHVVESSPYEVYQQKGIAKKVPLYESASGFAPSSDQSFIIKDVMEETRKELEKIAATNGSGVAITSHVRHGHSVDEILRAIDEIQPDLVVLPTHGRSRLKHMLLGSVAERVVRLSPVPVLTYRVKE